MKPLLLSLAFLTLLYPQNSQAITADQLAQFLGVQSWEVEVDLPLGTYSLAVKKVLNGAVVEDETFLQIKPTKPADENITLVIGPHDGKYKFSATLGDVTIGYDHEPPVPIFEPNGVVTKFGGKLKEGDYILFGRVKMESDHSMPGISIENTTIGFVLRVKKLRK